MKHCKNLLKTKKIIFALAALLLCAAITTGCFFQTQHKKYACQYAKPFTYSELEGNKKARLVAHRGAATLAPENTIPAYEKAAELGYAYAETDIRCTADGVWVLSHDASLKRMTGYDGIVEEMTLAEVQEHPITKGADITAYHELYTPCLEDLLVLCHNTGLIPVVEIKTSPAEYPQASFRDITNLLEQYNFADKAIVISFDVQALSLVREYAEGVQMQLLVKTLDEQVLSTVEQLGNCGIDCAYKGILRADKDLLNVAKSNGMVLNAWTVDSPRTARRLLELGVEYITTNAGRY